MLIHRDHDKARRYLDLLDTARCNGNWQEVPELVRKVEKHVPQRKCLHLTAQSECRIASQSSRRPTTSSSLSTTGLSQLIPSLLTAADNEKTFHEDAFQARVCLGWLHWTINEPSLAVSRLPASFAQVFDRLTREGATLTRWTHVCIVKGAYIRGSSQETAGNIHDAIQTYESMLPYISTIESTSASSTEHRFWTERLLARYCLLTSRDMQWKVEKTKQDLSPESTLAPFRAWADFWETRLSADNERLEGEDYRGGVSRRRIWQAYYNTASILLQQGFSYPSSSEKPSAIAKTVSAYDNKFLANPKLQQFAELQKVQAIYEGLLQREVKFPKANEANTEIESWVKQLIANWRVCSSSTWSDNDVGDGGKEALSRSVLAMLYRAATKSFHSTQILRQLFTVHACLAEFDLAGKALDSYLDIIVKGKARVEKSGEAELGLDDDATVLCTAAAGIKMLCVFGGRKEAERALAIASIVEKWLEKHRVAFSPRADGNNDQVPRFLEDQQNSTRSLIAGKPFTVAFRALGMSQAHWARLTYETSARSELQAKAISNFRTALEPGLGDDRDVETLYCLAFILAETLEVDAAILVVKKALSISTNTTKNESLSEDDSLEDDIDFDYSSDPDSRGLLLRCWHLLALLLSARQEYSTASTTCQAALEQYGGLSALLGPSKHPIEVGSLHLFERRDLIEIKMTQLALAEVVDGPEEAVNATGELLGLYAALFNHSLKHASVTPSPEKVSQPPSRNGTMRSFRGSILGRPKDAAKDNRQSVISKGNTAPSSIRTQGSMNEVTRTPTISVTPDDNAVPHSNRLIRHDSKKLQKRASRKSLGSIRRSRGVSPPRLSTVNDSNLSSQAPPSHSLTSAEEPSGSPPHDGNFAADEVGVAVSHDMPPAAQPLPKDLNGPYSTAQTLKSTPNQDTIDRNSSTRYPKPTTAQYSNRLSVAPSSVPSSFPLLPPPSFPSSDQLRHALTLLTKIWLLIASLYRRANLYKDAQGALSEALTHVQSIEAAVAAIHSSTEAFATPGWGGLKSVGELWADVHAEDGALHLALGAKDSAETAYEQALLHFPDHPAATVRLCNLLLDFYTTPPTPPPSTLPPDSATPILLPLPAPTPPTPADPSDPTLLSRLAARDRAYGLLSALTKSGRGWDCSEAWFALARCYEEGGQVEKAREALWWVVEVEEKRGVRAWGVCGGF